MGSGLDRVGEKADNLDTKAMGFRDSLPGVADTMKGTSQIAKGDLFSGFLTLGMGLGDLGSGIYNFIIPSLKTMSAGMLGSAKTMVATAATSVRSWVVMATQATINAARIAIAWVVALGPVG